MVALSLVGSGVRGSMPGEEETFIMNIFNLEASRGGDVQLTKWIAGNCKQKRPVRLLNLPLHVHDWLPHPPL